MFRQSQFGFDDRAVLGAFEGARPRAATVSMCRYTVPQSPICKPLAEPPTMLPDLILPPSGPSYPGLTRSISRLSCLDERLASSAPSNSRVLSFDSDEFDATNSLLKSGSRIQSNPSAEFCLVEEELCFNSGSERDSSRDHQLYFGIDDNEEQFTDFDEGLAVSQDAQKFGASPVLISCLRDMVRKSKTN
jgi:hypothetical protein